MTIDAPRRRRLALGAALSLALLLGLGPASGFFLPQAARGASHVRPPRAMPTTAIQLGVRMAGLVGGVTASAQQSEGAYVYVCWAGRLPTPKTFDHQY